MYDKALSKSLLPLVLGATLLAACGGSGGGGSAFESLGGVAATGAPLAGATVLLRCDGVEDSVTTSAQGIWQINVPEGSTPCAIRATGGGVTLYSYAATPGITNITPLTTLAVAHAVVADSGETDLDVWFDDPTDLNTATARTALNTALSGAGYQVPSGFNPFTTEFSAVAGNPYDDLLEAFADALTSESQSFDDFREVWTSGGELPDAPASYTIGGTITGLSGTVVLRNNGGNNLSRTTTGAFTFGTPVSQGRSYSVTVFTQPSNQTCTVANGSGTATANVTNIAVSCSANQGGGPGCGGPLNPPC